MCKIYLQNHFNTLYSQNCIKSLLCPTYIVLSDNISVNFIHHFVKSIFQAIVSLLNLVTVNIIRFWNVRNISNIFLPFTLFLAHLSWKLVSFSDHLSSVVCPSVHLSILLSVCKLSYFRLLLKNHWANFTKLCTKHPWVKGIQVCSNEEPRPFPGGNNKEIE